MPLMWRQCANDYIEWFMRYTACHMANTDKWYFAYTIEGNTIIIVDACHAQNMHED